MTLPGWGHMRGDSARRPSGTGYAWCSRQSSPAGRGTGPGRRSAVPGSEWPRRYGRPTTWWRRLTHWEESGVLRAWWRALLKPLTDRQHRRWNECVIDGRFAPAKRGVPQSGRPSPGRARGGRFWSMARVLRWEHSSMPVTANSGFETIDHIEGSAYLIATLACVVSRRNRATCEEEVARRHVYNIRGFVVLDDLKRELVPGCVRDPSGSDGSTCKIAGASLRQEAVRQQFC